MTDPEAATPAVPPRSSLLYAMGQLTAEQQHNAAEIVRLRESHEALPAAIVSALEPRFTAITTQLGNQDHRLGILERRFWLQTGGIGVLVVLTGWAVELVTKGAILR